ncbi:HNH endonuclease [Caballeronia sp. ATUFL_M1_KS5A]|uniref:HNH endonuclease n=1 Tax=Caballeronia sp. ATUFL_M1_KS5A TaxID=2921778 RepID=UPI002027B553|nr:HNH endonuclease [Caballeronia sp. ATUFL_M1_KS5A]
MAGNQDSFEFASAEQNESGAKASKGAKAKLRAFFLANIGRVIEKDELRNVANNQSEWARRVRELRTEEGYQILTHNDRSELKPGQYLLETAKPEPAFERAISKETRAFVLERNGQTCQMCGSAAGEPHPYDPTRKVRLHIGHIIDKSKGGSDEPSNLRALCSVCNEGAQNISPMRPDLKSLIIQVRRATSLDQLEVLRWLIKKFPAQSAEEVNAKKS